MSDPTPPNSTLVLLGRLHEGDERALGELLARDLDWIRAFVHARLSGVVRDHADTGDVVSDVALRVLKHGPRFQLSDREQFRGLLARIVINCLRSHAGRAGRAPRALGGGDTVLDLDRAGRARPATLPP